MRHRSPGSFCTTLAERPRKGSASLGVGRHRGWARSQQWFASCSGLGLVKRAVWLYQALGGSSSCMGPPCCPAFSSCPLDVLLLLQRIQLPGRMNADPGDEGVCISAICLGRCRHLLARLLLNGHATPISSRHAVPDDDVAPHPEMKGVICILAQTAHPALLSVQNRM